MKSRKYPLRCCSKASSTITLASPHCAFCLVHLCNEHSHDAEVEGHMFIACESCVDTLVSRRPGRHESCTCHDEDYCDIHAEIEGIG